MVMSKLEKLFVNRESKANRNKENLMKALVKDWMTSDPVTAPSSCTLPEAYWLMLDNKIRRLLVVEKGKLVGIVTLNDLRRTGPIRVPGFDLIHISDVLSKLPVRQLMTKNPKTISPATTLSEAAQLMIEHKISTLPVLDGNKLVGIITESDIFRAFVDLAKK